MKPFFSIVTPLYNKEKYIYQTVISVLKQTLTNYEYIIIDDGSTDNSSSIIKSFNDNRIKYYAIENSGVSNARNYGIYKSKGKFICFLDADDIWDENYLLELKHILEKERDADFICSGYNYFSENTKNILKRKLLKDLPKNKYSIINFLEICAKNKWCIALTSAVCIKREILYQLEKPFMPNISIGEDMDCWIRSALISKKAIYLNKALMYYRDEDNSSLCHKRTSLVNKTCPYWEWYKLSSNKDLKKITTLIIYAFARDQYKAKNYHQAVEILNKIKGNYLLSKRLATKLICLFKELI